MRNSQSRISTLMLLQILWSQVICQIRTSVWQTSLRGISFLGSSGHSNRTTWLRSSKMLIQQGNIRGTTIKIKTSSWLVILGSKSWLVILSFQVSISNLNFYRETWKSNLPNEAKEQASPNKERVTKVPTLNEDFRSTSKTRRRG